MLYYCYLLFYHLIYFNNYHIFSVKKFKKTNKKNTKKQTKKKQTNTQKKTTKTIQFCAFLPTYIFFFHYTRERNIFFWPKQTKGTNLYSMKQPLVENVCTFRYAQVCDFNRKMFTTMLSYPGLLRSQSSTDTRAKSHFVTPITQSKWTPFT